MEDLNFTFLKRANCIQLRISRNGLRKEITVPKIKPIKGNFSWNGKIGYTGRSVKEQKANRQLEEFRSQKEQKVRDVLKAEPKVSFYKLMEYITSNKFKPLKGLKMSDLLTDYLQQLEMGNIRNQNNYKRLSAYTLKTTASEVRKLIEMSSKIDIDLSRFKQAQLNNIITGSAKQEFIAYSKGLITYLEDRNYDSSTIHKLVRTVKRILKYYEEVKDIVTSPYIKFLKYKKPQYPVEVLSQEQSDFVFENFHRIKTECSTKQQEDALEYWLASLCTGARLGDMCNWMTHHITEEENGEMSLKYVPQKTSGGNLNPVEVPIFDHNLIHLFEANPRKYGGKLLPPIVKDSINQKLKAIAKRYEIFQVLVIRSREKGGEPIETPLPFYECIHIHMMRGTFITNMLAGKGGASLSQYEVKQISGHTENSQAFNRYVGRRPENLREAIRKQFPNGPLRKVG